MIRYSGFYEKKNTAITIDYYNFLEKGGERCHSQALPLSDYVLSFRDIT